MKNGQTETVTSDEMTLMSNEDVYLFNEGSHFHLYRKLGAHPVIRNGVAGTWFSVWSPDAEQVSVNGSFNDWGKGAHPLCRREKSGIWEGFLPGVAKGTLYKFQIRSRFNGYKVEKTDPFAFFNEIPPKTASIVWDLDYAWRDEQWMASRHTRNALNAPISIYEMHVGSWKRVLEEGNRSLTYRELAATLPQYLQQMGFTHVEFLPIMDHPFFGSWGYQTTGYFASSGCYGTPQDLMFLIDELHRHDIGVILDWVPSHFPTDGHGLGFFDGTHLYEHADPRQGFQPDWGTMVFNYSRNEVRSFLISGAMFWLDMYHADGLRVDAVASMLYLDYSRKEGEWIPNKYGGRENLEAIAFLRQLNALTHSYQPGTATIAEESTAFPAVSRPTWVGGLGFTFKWNMGWMHDIITYITKDAVYRRWEHQHLTFSMLYAFNENFILPFSHDEVVHGKGSMMSKAPGDVWQRAATLRVLYTFMYTHPGKKLLFMGSEIGQWREWDHESSLDWHLLSSDLHAGLQRFVQALNALYVRESSLYEI